MKEGSLPDPAEVQEILAIQVSRIGDTLLSTPTLRAIAAHFPNARLTVLGHPKRVDILRNIPFIDRVGTISKQGAWLRGLLTPRFYDLAFVFGYDEPLVRYALQVSHAVIAMEQASPALNRCLLHAAKAPAAMSRHAVFMQYALVEGLGIAMGERCLAYKVASEEAEWAKKELTRRGLLQHFPLLGLQIASFPTKGYRDWPVENFLELAQRVVAQFPQAHFLILGGELERERTQALAAQLGARATHFAGTLSLRQTAALMNCLDYYVGVDTGPTHIMGALHKPMMAFYHPSSPSKFLLPLDHPALTAIDHPLAGQVGPEAPMAGLTVDMVWSQLQLQLEKLQAR